MLTHSFLQLSNKYYMCSFEELVQNPNSPFGFQMLCSSFNCCDPLHQFPNPYFHLFCTFSLLFFVDLSHQVTWLLTDEEFVTGGIGSICKLQMLTMARVIEKLPEVHMSG